MKSVGVTAVLLVSGQMYGQQLPAPVVLHGKTMLLWPAGAPGACGEADDR